MPNTTFTTITTINRILIQTHHITSRKKIAHITKAAKRLSCSVLLKTGRSPGLMIAESISTSNVNSNENSAPGAGDGNIGMKTGAAEEWGEIVRSLRYKDFKLLRKDNLTVPQTSHSTKPASLATAIEPGTVLEVERLSEVGEIMLGCGKETEELWTWWSVRRAGGGDGGGGVLE